MASPVHKPSLAVGEYLAIERAAEFKSEFVNGEMLAMSGGTAPHARVATNLTIALGVRLRGGSCSVFNSDLRVNVSATGLYTYPDITVVCGELRLADDGHNDTLFNPTVLVEVLSPSTEAYDRGAKFAHYQRIDSLREYVLVAQDRPRVERYTRRQEADPNEWLLTVATGLDSKLTLPALGLELPLAEIYDGVDFAAESTTGT